MFKKSRIKIVAVIMSVIVFLWVGTLGVIFASSYMEMSRRNKRMLEEHAEMFMLSNPFDEMPPVTPKPDKGENRFSPKFSDSPMFQLSTFYTVALTYEGNVLEIRNPKQNLHSDDEIKSLAETVFLKERKIGRDNNLMYYKADKSGYVLVVFMDNTVINENASMLIRYTVLFGMVAIVIFFFLSLILAKKIVMPLEESYKKQKQFISDAGHELKTPVSVVSANAELLSGEIGDNKWLKNILYENERMGILVGQLLELARTENVEPVTETIDFSRLVKGEYLPFESVAFENGLNLICDTENEIFIEGDSTQLKQLVSILLDNGIRHCVDGGTVRFSLSKEKGFIRLSVINPGEEIPPEQRKLIFERFYRIDGARNGDDRHYGLGLAIAKSIVDAHKGRIEVICQDSTVEFKVLLPIK